VSLLIHFTHTSARVKSHGLQIQQFSTIKNLAESILFEEIHSMKKFLPLALITAAVVYASSFTVINAPVSDSEVPYPEGYRTWSHIKTAIVGPQNPGFKFTGGFHHIYANGKAMEGYSSGKFPEGSVLVFDVLEANEKNSDFAEGKRRHIDVMVKDSVRFAATGGWGYEEFKEGKKTERVLTPAIQNQCFTCHAKQKDFVFSDYRE
jgi:hypothetical protein